MPDSVAKVRAVIEGQRIGYPLSQSWAPLPPGITSLPAAPAPVVDGTYGLVITPTGLLRPYQESVRIDSVVKVAFSHRRLEYPLVLPTVNSTMRIRVNGPFTQHVGTFSSTLRPKILALSDGQLVQSAPMVIKVRFAQPPLFDPATLSPNMWLKADDSATISSTANAITQWRDRSGNNRHMNQSGADNTRPTLVANAQNGKAVVQFDGTNDILSSAANANGGILGWAADPNAFTVVVAVKVISSSTSANWNFFSENNRIWSAFGKHCSVSSASGGIVGTNLVPFNVTQLNTPWAIGTWGVITVTGNPGSLRLNTASTINSSGTEVFNGNSEFFLGGNGSVNNLYLNCQIGEVLTFGRALS
jgi:hypothetical protein